MTLSLLHGNSLRLPLADQSVHLVVTSPPYFALRDYQDEGSLDGQLGSEETPLHFLAALWAVMDECWRVLRDDGSCWINLGDKLSGSGGHNNNGLAKLHTGSIVFAGQARNAASRPPASRRTAPDRYNQNAGGLRSKSRMLLPHRFAEGLIDPDYRQWTEHRAGLTPTATPPQWICRMDAVWSKLNGLPESVTDRVRGSHENWFHLVKSERYYAAMDEIREDATNPRSFDNAKYAGKIVDGKHNTNRNDEGAGNWGVNQLGKLPGSVWTVATEPLRLPEYMVPERPGQLEPRWLETKDAWRWINDTGNTTSPWPQTPEDGRQLRAAPTHFAAFPSYFPRLIITGWSPSGVCTVCGEGRRPVCEKDEPVRHEWAQEQQRNRATPINGGVGRVNLGISAADRKRSITGYACACPTPTAPTTQARVLDPFSGTGTTAVVADALGRHGIGVDLSWDYIRIGHWRHNDSTLRAKALGVPKPPKQIEGQLSLMG
jgi:hypothetical protein